MIANKFNWSKLFTVLLAFTVILSSCNKELEDPGDITIPGTPTGTSLDASLKASADDSLFYRLVTKARLNTLLNDQTKTYTIWVPNNQAIKNLVAGLTQGAVPANAPNEVVSAFLQSSNISAATATSIVMYHIVPQKWTYASMAPTFPNIGLPTLINPAPTVSPLLRLDNYPSTMNGNWLNNVPVLQADVASSNGIIHHIAAAAVPPSQFLWQRIATDPNLTYFKEAINRADSGVVNSADSIQNILLNIGANLTIFAPHDSAFRKTLYGLAFPGLYQKMYEGAYQQAIAGGAPEAMAAQMATAYATANAPMAANALTGTTDVFKNPDLFSVLTPTLLKGIVFYHILGKRAFLNNFPTTETNIPTLLNMAVPSHPGVALQVGFGAMGPNMATVKGAANPTAATIAVNPFPMGSSDQNYLNGVIHVINQVLLPQ